MQRIIFATVAQAAKYLRPIINNSYEGITDPALAIRHFRKINCDQVRKMAARDLYNIENNERAACYTTKKISALIPNAYIIAQGSFQSKTPLVAEEGEYTTFYSATFEFDATIDQDSEVSISAKDLMSVFGLASEFEQLTIVEIERTGSSIYQFNDKKGGEIFETKLNAGRIVGSDFSERTKINVGNAGGSEFSKSDIDEEDCFNHSLTDAGAVKAIWGAADVSYDSDNEKLTITIQGASLSGRAFATGIIYSTNEDGSWKYSNTTMQLAHVLGENNPGLAYDYAIPAWFQGNEVADDGKFLSQGGDVNAIN